MRPMHLHHLKLLRPTVKELMYLQENAVFDLWIKVTQDVVQDPLHHVTCICKVWCCYVQWLRRCIYKNTVFELDRGLKVTQDVVKYPIHHVTYAHVHHVTYANLKLLRPTVWEEIHLQEDTLYDLDLGQGCTKSNPVPSTSCDLFTLKLLRPRIWEEMHLQENSLYERKM